MYYNKLIKNKKNMKYNIIQLKKIVSKCTYKIFGLNTFAIFCFFHFPHVYNWVGR